MNRRKGVPCGCDADPCGCSPKNHCVKAINNVSPDPNGDLNLKAGAGIAITQTGDDEITITNAATPSAFVEGKNIELNPTMSGDIEIAVVDDPVIDGTLTVNGDIVQNGAAYETHAEKVYTTNDYIVMRDGAVGGLAIGDYSGFQVEKYDGTNDGRLVIDRDGVARVGDVGDEQPLLTREESANLNNGALLKWDGVNLKAVDEGTVGSDTKPVKIVNGVATPVTDDLAVDKIEWITCTAGTNITIYNISAWCYNKIVHIDVDLAADATIPAAQVILTIPTAYLPPTDHTNPFGVVDDYNNPSVHYPYGIGWTRGGIFLDLTMQAGGRLRLSHTYVKRN